MICFAFFCQIYEKNTAKNITKARNSPWLMRFFAKCFNQGELVVFSRIFFSKICQKIANCSQFYVKYQWINRRKKLFFLPKFICSRILSIPIFSLFQRANTFTLFSAVLSNPAVGSKGLPPISQKWPAPARARRPLLVIIMASQAVIQKMYFSAILTEMQIRFAGWHGRDLFPILSGESPKEIRKTKKLDSKQIRKNRVHFEMVKLVS